MRRTKLGFTLVELLITIAIIGLLVTIASFGLRQAQASARDGKRQSDLETIAAGLEIYRAECNRYPAGISFGGSLNGSGTPASTCAVSNVYIATIPNDPLATARRYAYVPNSSGSTYVLCTSLEQGTGSVSGCGIGSPCGAGVNCNYRISRP